MHLIQKQLVDVTFNGPESQALPWQRELSALCENELLPALEKVLAPYDLLEDDLIFDYLSISVDDLRTDNFRQLFTDAVAQQLKATLAQKISLSSEEISATTSDVIRIKNRERREAQSAHHRNVEQILFHFLLHGVYPWWVLPDRVREWKGVMLNIFFESTPAAIQLLHILRTAPIARERLVAQFPAEWQQQLLQQIAPNVYAATLSVIATLQQYIPGMQHITASVIRNWQLEMVAYEHLPPLGVTPGTSDIMSEAALIASALTALMPAPLPQLSLLVQQHLPVPLQARVLKQLEQQAGISLKEKTNTWPLRKEEHNAIVSDGYYVHNAGLVLLAPFISRFLQYCGAADEKKLLRPGYATALLEWLATGRTDVGEEEMVLNKILCGIPLSQTIELITAIEPAHQQEAASLLSMVISNWPSLKNTSPEGLQASFLRRPGKLSVRENDDNWLLQVERESYDEWLLPDLPWGYNMVILPYTPHKMIWTEWI
ncbi:contractile injection system tape measure protein [Chitinophaga varians]|uniref:contractile injection system tape measure protein n=1 Tax=Chitinophaga varians TaxID=2202339 RepID=UPI00165FBEA4|nr:contractile injection system tape measure protein [Chitinophaga varians]MBC9909264.1 hypothetical protein [Chitinophaga varians]